MEQLIWLRDGLPVIYQDETALRLDGYFDRPIKERIIEVLDEGVTIDIDAILRRLWSKITNKRRYSNGL